jgi:hypothetical protein
MRTLLLAAFLALPLAASAQQATPQQQQQALGAAVMDLTQQNIGLRVQVVQLQDELKAAQQQLAAQKPAEQKAP